MTNEKISPENEIWLNKIRWNYQVRVISFALIFIYLNVINLIEKWSLDIFTILLFILVNILFNRPYTFIIKRVKKPLELLYISLFVDLAAISIIIYLLGSYNSYFITAFYLIIIIWCGTLIDGRAGMIFAGLSAAAITAVIFFETLSFSGREAPPTESLNYKFGWLITHYSFFFLFAYFSGYYNKVTNYKNEAIIKSQNKFKKINTRLKSLDTIKNSFLSVTAHQLRSPLSGLKWVFDLLLAKDFGQISAETSTLIKKARLSNERMVRLVNDLLLASRIDSDKLGYDWEDMDLITLIKNISYECREKSHVKKIKISFSSKEKKAIIVADKHLLSLAIKKIIDNAVNYSPVASHIRIEIAKYYGSFLITVSDQGAGIPREQQDKLYTKFFRADNVIKMQTEGSGLGIYISKNIIEKHSGKILIISEENKGTAVEISLPARDKSCQMTPLENFLAKIC